MQDTNPYAPPQSVLRNPSLDPVHRFKKYLIMSPSANLPMRCICCNEPTQHLKEKKLSYINPWWYLLFLINVLIFIIIGLFVTKRFTIQVPICVTHIKMYRKRKIMAWGLFVSAIGLSVLAITQPKLSDLLAISACFLFLISIGTAFWARAVALIKFKNTKLWISGCKNEFLDSLPEYIN